ncbi:DUF4097 family beta strand repeat-containing protein [Bacillus fonticola]|uniref:DUF4097 family beta strand repeat-containing protein n=1 Tax=Bacillus fonticola TaxID=2728853 RepID=UPI001473BF2D|nr:DUF4097 family beta strand repeat-containing protein [Bacillus fonticola]
MSTSERRRILRLVQEGKLSVEEAMDQLQHIEENDDSLDTWFLSNGEDHKKKEQDGSRKERLSSFLNQAIQKVKDIEHEVTKYEKISHVFLLEEAPIDEIHVDVTYGSVEIRPWDEPYAQVRCEATVYRADNPEEAKKTFLKETECNVHKGMLRLATQPKLIKVKAVLHVPSQSYEVIRGKLVNGSFFGEHLVANKLQVKTGNGKLTMQHCQAEQIEAEAANGTIHCKQIIADRLDAETLNGKITCEGEIRSFDVQSFNGNLLILPRSAKTEAIYAKASTGSIECQLPSGTVVTGDCETNFGTVNVSLPNTRSVREKEDWLSKRFRLQHEEGLPPTVHLFAQTKTGTITIKSASVSSS